MIEMGCMQLFGYYHGSDKEVSANSKDLESSYGGKAD